VIEIIDQAREHSGTLADALASGNNVVAGYQVGTFLLASRQVPEMRGLVR
jgi:hypothetical protein